MLSHLDQTVFGLTMRLNVTFSSTLSLEFYGQPLVATGEYGDFRLVAEPAAAGYADRQRPLPVVFDSETQTYRADATGDGSADRAFRRPDFNVRAFHSNAVLRWEYRSGSTVFVVWNQARDGYVGDGRFDLFEDTRDLFRTAGTNTLLVKFSYWFGL